MTLWTKVHGKLPWGTFWKMGEFREDLRGHRDVAQHRGDDVREELLERVGLIVVRVDKTDLTRHRRRWLIAGGSGRP